MTLKNNWVNGEVFTPAAANDMANAVNAVPVLTAAVNVYTGRVEWNAFPFGNNFDTTIFVAPLKTAPVVGTQAIYAIHRVTGNMHKNIALAVTHDALAAEMFATQATNAGNLCAFEATCTVDGTGNSIDQLISGVFNAHANAGATGTVGNSKMVFVDQIPYPLPAGLTIGTAYSLFVRSQIVGTENYSMYVEGGDSVLNGRILPITPNTFALRVCAKPTTVDGTTLFRVEGPSGQFQFQVTSDGTGGMGPSVSGSTFTVNNVYHPDNIALNVQQSGSQTADPFRVTSAAAARLFGVTKDGIVAHTHDIQLEKVGQTRIYNTQLSTDSLKLGGCAGIDFETYTSGSYSTKLQLTQAGNLVTTGNIELGNASDTTISRSSAGRVAVEGVDLISVSSTDTLTNKTLTSPTLTTPVLNGLSTGTGVATAATASTLALRDSNANVSADNFLAGFTSTATAAGTTTLTVDSTQIQLFTGSLAQTVTLPTTSVPAGAQYQIINNSTGAVTVQSSGANTVVIMATATEATFTALQATPTTAAHWEDTYQGGIVASGKSLTVSNTLTLAGTDGTTMTFPTTSATVARTDAANTFTGVQTMTSPALTTAVINGATTGTGVATANTVSTLVQRDASGNFAAGTITAALTGNASTATNLVVSTSSVVSLGTIELGAATDTTLSRSAAGVLSVEGVVVDTVSAANTLTNKRITRRIGTTTSTATPSIDCGLYDQYNITALAVAITGVTVTGTPTDGQELIVRIKGDATPRTITWGASFSTSGLGTLLATTAASKTHLVRFLYDTVAVKWICVQSDSTGY